MSVLDPFPADQNEILRNMQRQINALAAEVKRVTGTPVTQASGPFLVPSTSAPDAPPSGALLYVSGGRVWVHSSSAHYSTEPPDVPQAAFVDPAPAIVSGSAPGSYNSTWGQNIYNGLVATKDAFNDFRTSVIASGLMAGS